MTDQDLTAVMPSSDVQVGERLERSVAEQRGGMMMSSSNAHPARELRF